MHTEPQELHVPQVFPMPQDPFVEGDMTNAELRDALMNLTQLMTAQAQVVNNHFVAQANQGFESQPNVSTPASRIRDFMRMNPPTFHGTKVDDDPHGIINDVFILVDVMGVIPWEKEESAAYQLKDVAQVWFEKWRSERPLERDPVDLEEFKEAFLDRFFLLDWREKKMVEFMNLH